MGEIYLLPCQHSSYFSVQTNNRFTVSKTNIWVTGWRVWGSVLLGTHYWKQEGKPHNEKSLAGLQFMSARVWGEAITSETFGKLRHNMRGCCADKRRGRLCGSPSILLVPRRRYMKLNTQLLTTVTAAQKSWEFDIFAFEFTQRWWPREVGEGGSISEVVGSNPRTSGTFGWVKWSLLITITERPWARPLSPDCSNGAHYSWRYKTLLNSSSQFISRLEFRPKL